VDFDLVASGDRVEKFLEIDKPRRRFRVPRNTFTPDTPFQPLRYGGPEAVDVFLYRDAPRHYVALGPSEH
jgi:hypothetical protein